MATLEDLLREAAAKGLTHLSLHPVPSENNKTVYWRCSATPSTMHKYVSTTMLDPVESVVAVLKALPKVPRKSAANAIIRGELFDPKVTAAVTEPSDLAGMPEPSDLTGTPTEGLDEWLPKT